MTQVSPGDVVIGKYWGKLRPLIVLGIRKKRGRVLAIIAPCSTSTKVHRKKRGRKYKYLLKDEWFDNGFSLKRRQSWVDLYCVHEGYPIAKLKYRAGRIKAGHLVTLLMFFHFIWRKKNGR